MAVAAVGSDSFTNDHTLDHLEEVLVFAGAKVNTDGNLTFAAVDDLLDSFEIWFCFIEETARL